VSVDPVSAAAHLGWTLPIAREALKNHQQIQSAWERVANLLLGKKRTLAFTGMQGVGKTVLFDHLTGRAYRRGYKPLGRSRRVETASLKVPQRRLRMSVVPGQVDNVRLHATDNLFRGKKTVHGVIHVVANGFVEVRTQAARDALVKEARLESVTDFRNHQLSAELADLDLTCELIRNAIRESNRPTWMLVAVDKVDLYYPEISRTEEYYAPSAKSRFTERLELLQQQVGTDRFTWDAVPVCAWLEDFHWNGSTVPSTLKPHERDHYLAAFIDVLEEFCAADV
jgi:hypothetical protein